MNDSQIEQYLVSHHWTLTCDELENEIVKTSPQIIDVIYEPLFDLATIRTPENQFTLFCKQIKK